MFPLDPYVSSFIPWNKNDYKAPFKSSPSDIDMASTCYAKRRKPEEESHCGCVSCYGKGEWRQSQWQQQKVVLFQGKIMVCRSKKPERKHGSTRVPGHVSLRDVVAPDGWLCTFTTQQEMEIPSARSWAATVRATGTVRERQAVRPAHHIQNYIYIFIESP